MYRRIMRKISINSQTKNVVTYFLSFQHFLHISVINITALTNPNHKLQRMRSKRHL